jgi:hypothetical protein
MNLNYVNKMIAVILFSCYIVIYKYSYINIDIFKINNIVSYNKI